jgi:enoyl-CoA hydratase
MKVAFRQLASFRERPLFADEMRLEYRLASRIIRLPDFPEGVRAAVVDKDNAPRWRPDRLEDVGEDALDALFAPLRDTPEWTPLD